MIARPLTDLLKKDGFEWGSKEQRAFDELKQKMISSTMLALPNFEEQFVVKSDASGYGLGAVLMHNQIPISYFSKGLTDREKLKPVYERKLMSIVMAVQKWKHYLMERRFTVFKD